MPQPFLTPSSRFRRAALSLVSAVIASVIICSVVIAFNYGEFSRSYTSWFLFVRGAVVVITLAWLITLPLVMLFSRFDGWRLWFLALTGTLTGPVLLIAINLFIRFTQPSQQFDVVEGWKVEVVVTTISLMTTALYIGTVKLSTRGNAV
jgi:hypothetical protein